MKNLLDCTETASNKSDSMSVVPLKTRLYNHCFPLIKT